MKKFIILLLTLAFSMALFAQKVTQEQALQKAKDFFKDKGIVSNNLRRAASAVQQSDATQEDFYVFNAENKGGFVIVAGDDTLLQLRHGIAKGCRGLLVGVNQLQLIAARCQRTDAQQEGKRNIM